MSANLSYNAAKIISFCAKEAKIFLCKTACSRIVHIIQRKYNGQRTDHRFFCSCLWAGPCVCVKGDEIFAVCFLGIHGNLVFSHTSVYTVRVYIGMHEHTLVLDSNSRNYWRYHISVDKRIGKIQYIISNLEELYTIVYHQLFVSYFCD